MISQEPRPRSSRISRSSNTIMLREFNSSLTDYKKRNRYHIGVGKSNRLCDDEDSVTTRRGVGARWRKWRSPWNYPISGIPLPFLFLLPIKWVCLLVRIVRSHETGRRRASPSGKDNSIIKVCVCSVFLASPKFESMSSVREYCESLFWYAYYSRSQEESKMVQTNY